MPSHPRRVLLIAVATALPAMLVALLLLWHAELEDRTRWTAVAFIAIGLALGLSALHERTIRPLQTLANILAALREGDFSLRARGANPRDDSLGLVYLEANALADALRRQRLGALEASTLLRAVMAEIDSAILAFDDAGVLRLVNRRAEQLLGTPADRLLGRTATTLGLEPCLTGDSPRVLDPRLLPSGRWELRRSSFRQDGRAHQLVVLTDLSRTLQLEERQAWERLIRVLSHEINNSLAPIRSLAGSLRQLLAAEPTAPDREVDLRQGLDIIGQRAEALGRFMSSYARMARLPRPVRAPLAVAGWVERVATLETRLPVGVDAGPPVVISADSDQLDQLLINLVRNGVDATLETGAGGAVRIGWRLERAGLELIVSDEGPGVADSGNLFVPFYTTKPGGTGIGLALSRQIAEAHGGWLRLENRTDRRGARARLWLPLG